MKLSKYIKKLQEIQAEIGDVEVVTYDYGIKVIAYPPEVVSKRLSFSQINERHYHVAASNDESPVCRV